MIVLLVSALITGFGAYYFSTSFNRDSEAKAPPPAAPARIIPFTTFPGAANQPAFSPDGNQIAFAWDGGNGENLDLYIKLIGAGTPLRLTTDR
jgi:hypothetical protein